jgi:hypothetical protein
MVVVGAHHHVDVDIVISFVARSHHDRDYDVHVSLSGMCMSLIGLLSIWSMCASREQVVRLNLHTLMLHGKGVHAYGIV